MVFPLPFIPTAVVFSPGRSLKDKYDKAGFQKNGILEAKSTTAPAEREP